MVRVFLQIILVLIVLGGGVFAGFKLFMSKQSPSRVERKVSARLVSVQKVKAGNVKMVVHGFGTVRAKNTVTIVPEVSGRIIAMNDNFVDGGFFQAHQVLLTIDPRDYELAVRRAQAAVARAQVSLDQEKGQSQVARDEWRLIHGDKKPSSPLVFHESQILHARAELDAARAELARAELDLERTNISMPFDGRVVAKTVDIGQHILTGREIATVYGTDIMEIPVPLEDHELQWFSVGQGISDRSGSGAIVDVIAEFAGVKHNWAGSVVRTTGNIDPASRMVHVIVEVNNAFDREKNRITLVPGMFTQIVIHGSELDNVIIVPRSAVHNSDEVWLIRQGKLHVQQVSIARTDRDYAYVTKGIADNAIIITSSIDTVTEGMAVRSPGQAATKKNK